MRQLTIEESAEPDARPARKCVVSGCEAGDAEICGAYGLNACYEHLNRYAAEVPYEGKSYERDKADFATWARSA